MNGIHQKLYRLGWLREQQNEIWIYKIFKQKADMLAFHQNTYKYLAQQSTWLLFKRGIENIPSGSCGWTFGLQLVAQLEHMVEPTLLVGGVPGVGPKEGLA